MSGDYSRRRFDPTKLYSGVLKQQGRADLDADCNEYVELQDRRWRAGTLDVVGQCGIPAETLNGFQILKTSNGRLTIGIGRCYVDGHLAENHGSEPEFLPTLEENYGTTALPFEDQPYEREPETPDTDGRVLVYLDVWRREVSPTQMPDLVESALGVDTTTRLQTAWRVRTLPVDSSVTCETPFDQIPTWPDENKPSTARLTNSTSPMSPASNPCLIPPGGGYRGLENYLYRVEVHDHVDGATRVKWSRNNASFVEPILDVLPGGTAVRLAKLGHDDVLRFKNGDWVEITNDRRELRGLPGEMRKVTTDPGTQTLGFAGPLPVLDFPEGAVEEKNHLRVIGWDHQADEANGGLIPLTDGEEVALEHGITIMLQAGQNPIVHYGDHWCFAARTAEADIEKLTGAPPFGVHHHFCKLAIVDRDSNEDCREIFLPLTEVGKSEPGVHVLAVFGRTESSQMPLLNDTAILADNIVGGIQVECDTGVHATSISRATCFLTVETPFQQPGIPQPVGYFPVALAADVSASESNISWIPKPEAATFLKSLPDIPPGDRGLLARLTLKGNFISAAENANILLDGDGFGIPDTVLNTAALQLPSGDQRRGGDFEMWFWLTKRVPASVFSITVEAPLAAVTRPEGVTEIVADLVLVGTGGVPTATGTAVPRYNIQVVLNTPVTSPAAGNWIDGVLLVDEPVALNTTALTAQPPAVTGVGGNGLDYRNAAVPNIFLATQASPNSVLFSDIPLDPPPAGQERRLRIKNLRANVNQLVSPSVPATMQAMVAVSGAPALSVNNPVQTVGLISSNSITQLARADRGRGLFTISRQHGVNQTLASTGQDMNAQTNLHIDFTEAFATAFKVRKQGSVSPFQTSATEETGFDNVGEGALPIQAGPELPEIGTVLCGTRFVANFLRVPPGVRIFVTTRDVPQNGSQTPARAVLVTDPNQPLPSEVPPSSDSATEGIAIVELRGRPAVWEWIDRTAQAESDVDTVRFGIVLAAQPNGPAAGQGPALLRLFLAPAAISGGGPVPRFQSAGATERAFQVGP
jgi:hypothetical protein